MMSLTLMVHSVKADPYLIFITGWFSDRGTIKGGLGEEKATLINVLAPAILTHFPF